MNFAGADISVGEYVNCGDIWKPLEFIPKKQLTENYCNFWNLL